MTQPSVLIAYGSKRGGTAEIAHWIGDELRAAHIPADIANAREIRSLDGYDAVVLGGALYMGRWHRHARGFARRFGKQLRERPVWVFGSGPLDHSLDGPNPPKILGGNAVRTVAERLHARDHTLFGGRLKADATGFPAAAMAKKAAGDYRNRSQICTWAADIAAQLIRQPR
ncbi:flavodoxin domain-containing protein [Nocardia sp. CDC159]|uniref:Flavodoxin domain-containing protein n=1 Tax=Nocardia pulmonis TaxID=2951408 RepID=A0A9X2IVF6_9NOCA|nr:MULTISPECIES: flavodoxin domain-containing protein [Nocardia]MCM6772404.1 flavodoxin domain-containing protein [Nocardia pulmonis]MCM6784938.1 flavodoxin domain-containing protein [Nocardia sp. CDC159]